MKDWSVPLLPRGQREGAEKGQLAAQQDASAETEIEGIVELDTFRILYDRRHLPSENSRKRKKKRNCTMNDRSSQQSCDIPLSLSHSLALYFAFDPCALTANLAAVKDISVISTKTKEQRVPAIIYVGVVFRRKDD